MFDIVSVLFLSRLAKRLAGIFDCYDETGFLFFDTVKFVKFTGRPNHNMIGARGYFPVRLPQ